MSLLQLQESVLSLPEPERHQFFAWVNQQEASYGDVNPEAVCQFVAEVWDDLANANHARAQTTAR